MADEMRVDPQQLRGAAPHFDVLADRLTDALSELASTLDTEGASWGTDAPGTAFASMYVPGADGARSALRHVAEVFAGVAGGLRDTAEVFEQTDSGLAGTLGGGH
ncbi:WXG100 family type VII secretion target [Rhodococcus sp. TAF43]|uniref:WXG100 family type VII secretion target n=1 Tax=unclassified Rhodococcus (in: high G+C Gram-positive bacteria) TaxID=192944 RepID=UPI0020C6AA44|nr:WXG100 family type VII secretion target [Rhodococcus sp. W8901]